MNNVYLIPHDDGSYGACISPTPPTPNAALLTSEGEYPVECYYRRFDTNGDSILEGDVCANQNELLRSLNNIGQAYLAVHGLWDYHSNKSIPSDVCAIFNAATPKAMEIADVWVEDILSIENKEPIIGSIGQPMGTPTVKELMEILSSLPEDYRVTCCGTDWFIHLFDYNKTITIDSEEYLP